jgi:hypothetical protein
MFKEIIVPTTATIFISDLSEHRPLLELSKEAIFEEKIKSNGEMLNSNAAYDGVRANYVTSYFAHHDNKKFTPLIDLILKTAKDIICKNENFEIEFSCINAWGMEYLAGDYALPHRHMNHSLGYSASCYIDVDDDCSPIIFENHTVVKPKSNMFLFFPGNISHYVPKTKGKRILMSYNFI